MAPPGSSAEVALNAALDAGHQRGGEAEVQRDALLGLIRKFSKPDEHVLGVHFQYEPKKNGVDQLSGMVVILTHGYAIKSGSKRFRAEAEMAMVRIEDKSTGLNVEKRSIPRIEVDDDGILTDTMDEYESVSFYSSLAISTLHFTEYLDFIPNWNLSGIPTLYAALRVQNEPPGIMLRVASIATSRIKNDSLDANDDDDSDESEIERTRPESVLIRSWRDAELSASKWLKFWRYSNVILTANGADGGIDVFSDGAVVQVKAEGSPTGRPKIQQLHGVAVSQNKQAIFFALAGFTSEAKVYAQANRILLFSFDLQGDPEPVNTYARELVAYTN